MKPFFLSLILISLVLLSYSQKDSTTIYFDMVWDRDIKNICDVSDIQLEKVTCRDTLMRGKDFNVIIKEYKKGVVQSTTKFDSKEDKKQVQMIVDGELTMSEFYYSSGTKFDNADDSFTITFVGKFENNRIKYKVDFPTTSSMREFKAKENYIMRHMSYAPMIEVPLDKEYPILAYSPIFDSYNKEGLYIMPGADNVFNWYKQFGVKHYYVFFLEIK